MLREIPEADWKILRRLHPLAEVEKVTHNHSRAPISATWVFSRSSDRAIGRSYAPSMISGARKH